MRRFILLTVLLILPMGGAVAFSAWREQTYYPRRFAEVLPGCIFRGGFPSAEQIHHLARDKSIRTVVSLTSDSGEPRDAALATAARQESLMVLRFAMPGDGVVDDYTLLDQAADAVANSRHWPVFFHCAAGKQRSNAVTGAYFLKHSKWPLPRVLQELETRYDLDRAREARLVDQLRGYQKWLASGSSGASARRGEPGERPDRSSR